MVPGQRQSGVRWTLSHSGHWTEYKSVKDLLANKVAQFTDILPSYSSGALAQQPPQTYDAPGERENHPFNPTTGGFVIPSQDKKKAAECKSLNQFSLLTS